MCSVTNTALVSIPILVWTAGIILAAMALIVLLKRKSSAKQRLSNYGYVNLQILDLITQSKYHYLGVLIKPYGYQVSCIFVKFSIYIIKLFPPLL